MARSGRNLDVLVMFVLLFGSYAYFNQGGGVNQFTRWALTVALVEHHSLQIDPYHELTIDKALKDGHYYCDKSPGVSLTGVPWYLVLRAILGPCPDLPGRGHLNWHMYGLTVLTISLPVALAGALFYGWVRNQVGALGGFWVTLAVWLGSPLGVYAGLFYGHALCAALLWLAYLVLWPGRSAEERSSDDTSATTPLGRAGLAGFLAGWATLAEMRGAVIVALFALTILLTAVNRWKAVLAYVAGGLPWVAVLLTYNTLAFGHPLDNAYRYEALEVFRESMNRGLMGIGLPSLRAFLGILISTGRGLLIYWPFFTFCVIPALLLVPMSDNATVRRRGWFSLAILAVMLTLCSGYYMWWGGSSFTCRHLVPAIPFIGMLVVLVYSPVLKWIIPLATILSLGIVLISVATCAEFQGNFAFPLRQLAWDNFSQGELMIKTLDEEGKVLKPARTATDTPPIRDAWTFGDLLGLTGLTRLVPLALFEVGMVALFVVAVWWRSRGVDPLPASTPGESG